MSAAFLAACASTSGSSVPKGAPDFVLNPPQSDTVIYGVGYAKLATTNMGLTMAETRARAAVARELGTVVKQMIDDYAADASEVSGNKGEAEAFAQSVSRSLSGADVKGAKVIRREQTDDGTWWVLVSYDKTAAEKDALAQLNKDKVNYAAFKNWNAQRDMDAAFDKLKSDQTQFVGE